MLFKIRFSLLLSIIIFATGCGYKGSKKFTLHKYGVGKQRVIDSPNMHKATMRPYKIRGSWYYPYKPKVGTVFNGVASWYGPNFHAKKTSNGEYYNMYTMTAAHKTLPMNTILKVINKRNNKSVIVRINDRGPFVNDRIIDLSKAAADELDIIKYGTSKVKLIVLGFNNKKMISSSGTRLMGGSFSRTTSIKSYDTSRIKKKKKNNKYKKKKVIYNKNSGNFKIQLGSFKEKKRAIKHKKELSYLEIGDYKLKIIRKNGYFKVKLIGFDTKNEARDFVEQQSIDNYFITN